MGYIHFKAGMGTSSPSYLLSVIPWLAVREYTSCERKGHSIRGDPGSSPGSGLFPKWVCQSLFFNNTQLIVNNSKNNLIWVRIPISAYYSYGSIPVLKDEILSARQNRYHGAGECRPGIRARQNFRGIIGAPGDRKGRNLE